MSERAVHIGKLRDAKYTRAFTNYRNVLHFPGIQSSYLIIKTSIECALGRLIVPSGVLTVQLVALKGQFQAFFMLIFVQIYQSVNACLCL